MIEDELYKCIEPVDFSVSIVKNARVIWASDCLRCQGDGFLHDERLLDEFCYANPKSKCFSDIDFKNDNVKTVSAERYGGLGVGENGGGVRCGNLGEYQVKGIGINPLLGEHDNYDHSTGRYPLEEAMFETISSVILDEILPGGVARIHGLFYLGRSRHSFDWDGKKYHLALTVREKCFRPGHLLPQPSFNPFNRYKHLFRSDLTRLRIVNREFFRRFESTSDLIKYFGSFLTSSANQLAFSKLFRIAHGAYSPSNVCFDGRWLDLTNMTMVPAGSNYAASADTVAFLDEPKAPIGIVEQVLYNLGKFNYKDFSVQPLASYYYDQFHSYINYYAPLVVGVPMGFLSERDCTKSRNILSEMLVNYINDERYKEVGFPLNYNKHNSYVNIIEKIFIFSSNNQSVGLKSISNDVVVSSKEIFRTAYRNYSKGCVSLKAFVKSCLIRSLRKAYTTPLFTAEHIESRACSLVEGGHFKDMESCIDQFKQLAVWVFDKMDSDSSVTM